MLVSTRPLTCVMQNAQFDNNCPSFFGGSECTYDTCGLGPSDGLYETGSATLTFVKGQSGDQNVTFNDYTLTFTLAWTVTATPAPTPLPTPNPTPLPPTPALTRAPTPPTPVAVAATTHVPTPVPAPTPSHAPSPTLPPIATRGPISPTPKLPIVVVASQVSSAGTNVGAIAGECCLVCSKLISLNAGGVVGGGCCLLCILILVAFMIRRNKVTATVVASLLYARDRHTAATRRHRCRQCGIPAAAAWASARQRSAAGVRQHACAGVRRRQRAAAVVHRARRRHCGRTWLGDAQSRVRADGRRSWRLRCLR
jgi:hypothetical protein